MTSTFSLPNIVTIVRMLLVFVVVILAYGHTVWDKLLAALFAVLIVVGDWLDGHLARKLDKASTLGSVLDIAADRILETVMWIILADLDLIPIWIPVVVISRGILTDSIRGFVLQFGYSGFGSHTLQKSRIGKFVTGSPIMRTGYALVKAFSFGWLLLFEALSQVGARWEMFDAGLIATALKIGYWAAILAAVLCLVRGVPVVIEGIAIIRREEARVKGSDSVGH
ncbi:MAG: CDP-alcohol phosphatidyltransferase family protein [candidate division Zixibacteria bacterium]|nr:CDP-alcohol phosphatidyltransferase family protein [candidate division Zixibacteria bacterium]